MHVQYLQKGCTGEQEVLMSNGDLGVISPYIQLVNFSFS